MLSSNVLERQFGETRVVIMKQNTDYRIIKTIAVSSNEILELSLVTFDQNTVPFPDIHQQIIDGASIGKAFEHAGVPFIRTTHSVIREHIPKQLQLYPTDKMPATIVDVDIYVGDEAIHYCHILEIYSPIVNWPQPTTASSEARTSNALDHFTKLLGN
jgi:hypothetical protein